MRIRLENYLDEECPQKAHSLYVKMMHTEPYARMDIKLNCYQEDDIPLDKRFIAETFYAFNAYEVLFCAKFISELKSIITLRSPELIATINAKDQNGLSLTMIKNREDISEEAMRKEIVIQKVSDNGDSIALQATKEILKTRYEFFPDNPELNPR